MTLKGPLGVLLMSKKITFSIPDHIYDGLSKFPCCKVYRIDDLFKACAINRLIERGYLDEFGQPIELPSVDFSSISFGDSISEELRNDILAAHKEEKC